MLVVVDSRRWRSGPLGTARRVRHARSRVMCAIC